MSDSEKHVTITERCFDAVRLIREEIVIAERLLIGAVCLVQACAIISCDRDFTDPVHIEGADYTQVVGFQAYDIDIGGGIGHFLWTTTTETSTSYRWRLHEGPGAWVDHLDTPATLTTAHSALLDGPFDEGVVYDFQPYGTDPVGVTYVGRVVMITLFMGEWFMEEIE